MTTRVIAEKLTPTELIRRACSFTSGVYRPGLGRDMVSMYKAEHSPIRTQAFAIYMYDIPTYVSTHLCRHKHGVEHFVESKRNNPEVNRNTPINHMMVLNAQALISIARVRLCKRSAIGTQRIMDLIKQAVHKEDEALAVCMVPNCIYRGSCPEMKPCGRLPHEPNSNPE